MSVYDFDGGASNEYVEELVVGEYAYYKTPLRPASGAAVTSTLLVDKATGTFTSTSSGTSADNPTDPTTLSDDAAGRAMQIFFRPDDGYVDATFKVSFERSV